MLRMTKTALLALSVLVATSAVAMAQDQESGAIDVDLPARQRPSSSAPRTQYRAGQPGPLRAYGGFNLAVGGEMKGGNAGVDLDPTVGLQGGADFVVMDYFSIGGEMRFLWFKTDGADDRSFLWDLSVKPRGRFAFDNLPLEVYGALPFGLTVPGISGDLEGKVGFNIGLVGGANWWFTENMGVNAEMGWVFHKFSIEGRTETRFGNLLYYDDKWKMNQFLLLCPNFIYAF